MLNQPHRIIGINPGTRYLGLAAFQGYDLRDWRVKAFKGRWSKGKDIAILASIQEYMEKFRPEVVAIKKLHPSRSSKGLTKLISAVLNQVISKGMRVKQYSIEELEAKLNPSGRTNKKTMVLKLIERYPELLHEGRRESKNRNPYHIKMFEAVALGSTCLQELSSRRKMNYEDKWEDIGD